MFLYLSMSVDKQTAFQEEGAQVLLHRFLLFLLFFFYFSLSFPSQPEARLNNKMPLLLWFR